MTSLPLEVTLTMTREEILTIVEWSMSQPDMPKDVESVFSYLVSVLLRTEAAEHDALYLYAVANTKPILH
jgi:hypothetical protein